MKFSFALVSVFALLFQFLSMGAVLAQTASLSRMNNLIPSFRFAKPASFTTLCKDNNDRTDPLYEMFAESRHTIDELLLIAGTQNCQKAESQLKNLTSLSLVNKRIVDLSPLASLVNLKTLDLHHNNITNVEGLSHLTNLTSLNLAMNKVFDVKPLASLNNLTTLDLYNNQIKDVTSLASLNKLTTLDLSRNEIEPKICPLNSASICEFGSI